ncbi:SRPBCC family protein [Pseudonocardia hydrocarbonoxydans]|uniref:Polyketide cyclase n=2 Tax=Pseudonocardia hydrocarbonoxydans TaxID=76726 RepID=A0A4Y3WNR1_9PSEU|nr:hypothetical protein PHY01_27280 [Pseudonocardia hydrocarbonoxydans]
MCHIRPMDEVTTTVAAPPERVWALVTDITRMGEWSPESTGGRWRGGATGPATGARFVGGNRNGWVRWSTHCRVVECTAPSRFAFTVAESRMTWGWRLEPDGDGTRLTQWRERTGTPNVAVRALAASGLLGRDREQLMVDGMHRTVAAVKAAAER